MYYAYAGGEKMKAHDASKPRPFLTTHSLIPENQEAPISFLSQENTSNEYFYRRNHFLYPSLTDKFFLLYIDGEVERPLVLSYLNLLSMPSRVSTMVLECSGNKRANFEPKTFGVQWEEGAISQNTWRGVPLRYLLNMAGIKRSALEVVFEGHDMGTRTDAEGIFSFKRSLPIDKANHPDTLVAYALDNKPISYKHGYPLRLVVPDWYAMASVKWLKRITVIDRKFRGPFQTVDYVYYPDKNSAVRTRPVTTIKVNSIIQSPTDYIVLDKGIHKISGISYTGEGVITKVEISVDGGSTWNRASFDRPQAQSHSWVSWHYMWYADKKGEHVIMVKASDSNGRTQPSEAEWNRKGYGYNAIAKTHVKIE